MDADVHSEPHASLPGSLWADASKDARLREMHAGGISYSAIAAELGCTRNAAIGRAMRIGLGPKSNGAKTRHAVAHINRAKAAVLRIAKPKPKPKHNQTSPELRAERAQAAENMRAQLVREANSVTADAFDAAIPKRQRKTIYQLTNRTCRFPVGDPAGKGFFFCGGKADNVAGQVYCCVHMARAFNGVPKKPRHEFRGRG